jgi:hypothetical protein
MQITSIEKLRGGAGDALPTVFSSRMARRAVLGLAALSLTGCVTDTAPLSSLASADPPDRQERRPLPMLLAEHARPVI